MGSLIKFILVCLALSYNIQVNNVAFFPSLYRLTLTLSTFVWKVCTYFLVTALLVMYHVIHPFKVYSSRLLVYSQVVQISPQPHFRAFYPEMRPHTHCQS